MKEVKRDANGREIEKHLEDLPDPETPSGGGGGGGGMAPGIRSTNDGYLETWDVVEAPFPTHAKALPPDAFMDEDR